MTNEKLFEYIGLNRAQIKLIIATEYKDRIKIARGDKPRPNCLVCGQRINSTNCRPFRQPVAESKARQ